MKTLLIATAVLVSSLAARAALKTGESLTPYEIKNSRTGAQYCQVCAYGAKSGKIVAFGKLNDPEFWADLQKLQTYADQYKELGVFAQVIDSADLAAIKAAADQHGVKFPVVVAVEKDWDAAYKVGGVSRTIYYAQQDNKIVWTTVGLEGGKIALLQKQLKTDFAS